MARGDAKIDTPADRDEREKDARDARKQRSDVVRDAIGERSGPSTHRTRRGDVELGELVFVAATDTEPAVVEVRPVGDDSGEVAYRIVNPPVHVTDIEGDIDMNGQYYRQDPVAAIAEVIAQFTGPRRRRR